MGFVSLFFAFAFALFLLNRIHKRTTFKIIPLFNWWKAAILIFTGKILFIFFYFGIYGDTLYLGKIYLIISEKIDYLGYAF